MGDWTTQDIPEFIARIILIFIIPIASFVWAWLKSVPKPYLLPIVVVSFASCLVIFKNLDWKKPALTPEKIEDHLRDLAYKARFGIKDDSKEADRFRFVLKTDKTEKTTEESIIIINRKENSQSHIVIATGIAADAGAQELLGRMNEGEKLQFASNIKIELLKHGISYKGIEYPFEKIILTDEFVYDESLTLIEFVNKLKPIRRATTLLGVLISTKATEIYQQ